MRALTINELLKECQKQKKLGNGDKRILISTDDEGNGYHELFFTFSNANDIFSGAYPPHKPYSVEDINEYVVLG